MINPTQELSELSHVFVAGMNDASSRFIFPAIHGHSSKPATYFSMFKDINFGFVFHQIVQEVCGRCSTNTSTDDGYTYYKEIETDQEIELL